MGLFEISDDGWKQQNRGRSMYELAREAIQNALDMEDNVIIKIKKRQNKVVIQDQGPGFDNIEDAYTIYGGDKSDDPTKRGRFGRGLKELIAGCDNVKVFTTSGSIEFDVKNNERVELGRTTQEGTKVVAHNEEWTDADFNEFKEYVYKLWPPEGQDVLIDVGGGGLTRIERAEPDYTANMRLPTVVYNNGEKESVRRSTRVHIKKTKKGDGRIYEMGIPVNMKEEFPFWVDVQQRCPLAEQRNEVDSRYKDQLMAKVLNEVAEDMSSSELKESWVVNLLDAFYLSDDVKETYVSKVVEDNRKKGIVIKSSNKHVNDKCANEGYQVYDAVHAPASIANAVKATRPSAESKVAEIHNRDEQQVEPTPGEKETIRKAEAIAETLGYHNTTFEMWELGMSADGTHTPADHSPDGRIRLNREARDWEEFDAKVFGSIVHEISHENGSGHDKAWYMAMQNNFARLAQEYGMLKNIE